MAVWSGISLQDVEKESPNRPYAHTRAESASDSVVVEWDINGIVCKCSPSILCRWGIFLGRRKKSDTGSATRL